MKCITERLTDWEDGVDTHELFHHCLEVGQVVAVRKVGKPVRANYAVQFFLRLALDVWVEQHGEEKAMDLCDALWNE